jgi:Na+/H+-dicarboxylate symporter
VVDASPNSPDAPASVEELQEQGHSSGRLTLYICIAIVLAIAVAWFFPRVAMSLAIGGDIFLNLLFMVVVPLVVTSVMGGVLGMGDVRKLGVPGLATIAFFLGTTAIAVLIGIAVVNVIRPGVGVSTETASNELSDRQVREKLRDTLAETAGVPTGGVVKAFPTLPSDEKPSAGAIAENLVRMLFTKNLIASAANADLLPLIGFSLLFAAVLTTMGPRAADLSRLVLQTNDALMVVVMLLMKIAPLGIFCLVAARFGAAARGGQLAALVGQLGWYMAAVLIGLAIHAFLVLPLLFCFFVRKNPYVFIGQMAESLLTAFSTASSTATVPVTLEAAVTKAGISRKAADFVIPLGATINMNGTALYEAAAALFIAQAYAMHLSLGQQAVVAVTSTLAAIGAAGIPEAGLVTMIIVLTTVGLPVEGISIILAVDWLLDRFRTAVNVFGDAIGAAVVEKTL